MNRLQDDGVDDFGVVSFIILMLALGFLTWALFYTFGFFGWI